MKRVEIGFGAEEVRKSGEGGRECIAVELGAAVGIRSLGVDGVLWRCWWEEGQQGDSREAARRKEA